MAPRGSHVVVPRDEWGEFEARAFDCVLSALAVHLGRINCVFAAKMIGANLFLLWSCFRFLWHYYTYNIEKCLGMLVSGTLIALGLYLTAEQTRGFLIFPTGPHVLRLDCFLLGLGLSAPLRRPTRRLFHALYARVCERFADELAGQPDPERRLQIIAWECGYELHWLLYCVGRRISPGAY